MKSTIRISLSKAQSTRHVCSTSSRPLVVYLPFVGGYQRVVRALDIWLNSLVESAKEDAGDEGRAAGSHYLRLTAYVTSDTEGDSELLIMEHVSCAAVCLLSRNLVRIEREVYRRLLRDGQYGAIWDIIPFSYRPIGETLSTDVTSEELE